jgi:hypothetical protein
MKKQNTEIYDIVNLAIDRAVIDDVYNLNFYSFLEASKLKRAEVISFLDSVLVSQMYAEIENLDLYLLDVADLVEVYGWMGKQRSKRYREYILKIIEDAKRYEQHKKPGRKPGSKSKQTTNGNK